MLLNSCNHTLASSTNNCIILFHVSCNPVSIYTSWTEVHIYREKDSAGNTGVYLKLHVNMDVMEALIESQVDAEYSGHTIAQG